jgi:hypothetical protein
MSDGVGQSWGISWRDDDGASGGIELLYHCSTTSTAQFSSRTIVSGERTGRFVISRAH